MLTNYVLEKYINMELEHRTLLNSPKKIKLMIKLNKNNLSFVVCPKNKMMMIKSG